MPKDRRQKRDRHALDDNGMVVCNPRDKEAAHRAQTEGIATDDRAAVTCRSAWRCSTDWTKRSPREVNLIPAVPLPVEIQRSEGPDAREAARALLRSGSGSVPELRR